MPRLGIFRTRCRSFGLNRIETKPVTLNIPQAAPLLRHQRFRGEIDDALNRVLGGNHAILGPEVMAFECEFALYCGMNHATGVASGTDALHLSLKAAGIGPGDEVLVPALTAAGTAQAVCLAGATPVYVDVDPHTRCMDPEAANAAIGPETAAIILVHLYGHPADANKFAALATCHGLFLLEDCAQAHGAEQHGRKVGSFGHAAAFSFYPTKNLGALGDGGAVVTSDAALADKVRMLRNHGWVDAGRVSQVVAGNSRLDEIQAAILRVLLLHLDEGNTERTRLAHDYRQELDGFVALPDNKLGSVWHQFVIEVENRAAVIKALAKEGIGSTVHYHPPLHHQPALSPATPVSLPHTERLSREVLSLPIQPEAVGRKLPQIADAVKRAVRS